LQLSPAVNNALLGSGDQDQSLLISNRADFQRNLEINKVEIEKSKNLFIAAARDMSAALQNAAIQTNGEATNDDYFAFPDSADTEASQAASDITNKCDLELGSAAVSR